MRGDVPVSALCAAVVLSACTGPQSALHPVGPTAASIHVLGLFMYAVAAAVTVLVVALALAPFLRKEPRRANSKWFLWGGGVVLPATAIGFLMPHVFSIGQEPRAMDADARITIEVTGHVFWWDVAYRHPTGNGAATTANEVRLPAGEPVELLLRSADVIHSFWVPSIAGKTDMIPGRTTRMVIRADAPGIYRGQCAEYCGLQHALMAFDAIVVPRAEFDAWLEALARPVREPANAEHRAGREHFLNLGCGACHTVRGVSEGRLGPDLTNVGARRTIGAGTIPGGEGNIAGWIASAQHLKPGNAMPSYDRIEGTQLRTLAAWLAALQ